MEKIIVNVNELRVDDIPLVGGKGANLGELTFAGFPVPGAFILTTKSYDYFFDKNNLKKIVEKELLTIDEKSDQSLAEASDRIRTAIEKGTISENLKSEIISEYNVLFPKGKKGFVAVRSSATAEDLPDASFAGQQDTYLNVSGEADLLDKVRKCWSSLFTARAISYRQKCGYGAEDIKLAVVVQKMVNSDISGIMFTVDPNTGADHIIIEAGYGLGEAIVGGEVTPDTYAVDKREMKIENNKTRISTQSWMYVRGKTGGAIRKDIETKLRNVQKIADDRILEIAEIGRQIEIHYQRPMDIEWCIEDGKVYIVQARPITAIGDSATNECADVEATKGNIITSGMGASPGLATGRVIVYDTSMSLDIIKDGDILVTKMTMPDMVPAMSRAVAIVTNEGGMTCHAAIISRELGTPCVVGTSNATKLLRDGMIVTVDGTTGTVYKGEVKKKDKSSGLTDVQYVNAELAPVTGTKIMVNMSMPTKADEVAELPCDGVGLMRSEFLFTNYVGEHPMYVIADGRSEELIEKLAEGISKVARAFYPRPVVLRTSDFKTNEYHDMKGGADYEPSEDNPMIGWRGCSRYVSPEFMDAFICELEAIKKVRNEMGLKNLHIMLPFVRTIQEVKDITKIMEEVGLRRGTDLKLYLMAEVPVNIFMAEEFCEYCDAFSIGSNDLTQLILGCDRDSDVLGRMGYFDERNEGVKRAIKMLIEIAHKNGKTVGICGQGPSVYPEFAEFLVECGIDSISLNPDTVIATKKSIASVEQKIMLRQLRELKEKF